MSGQMTSRGLHAKGKLAAAAIAAIIAAPSVLQAAPPAAEPLNLDPNVHWFAAWDENLAAASPDFFATPEASLNPLPFVQTQLNGSATMGRPLGIKVVSPLSSSTASSLFNSKYPLPSGTKAISYVFADFENASSTVSFNNTKALVSQVRGSSWSKNAFVGQFDLIPINATDDPSRRGAQTFTHKQFDDSHVNMANTVLYPGSASFKNKSTHDWSNANIRTGLFIGPIERMTVVQKKLKGASDGDALKTGTGNQKQIPWVTRFNNAANLSLDTDNNPSTDFKFIPGQPLPQDGLTGAQTANQMMGRGDFSAQILHYRMRGAYSVNLFTQPGPNGGGVIGYSGAMAKQDVRDGWYGGSGAGALAPIAHANSIFAAKDNKRATMSYNPTVDGTSAPSGNRSEISGTVWSGVYSLSMGKLDILLSNLDTVNHKVKFDTVDVGNVFMTKNGAGYVYDDGTPLEDSRNALIEAGVHRLLQFDLVKTRVYKSSTYAGSYSTKTIWLLNQNYQVFANNNRNDVGIPEPTTFGILAAAGSMTAVCRRHRRSKKA